MIDWKFLIWFNWIFCFLVVCNRVFVKGCFEGYFKFVVKLRIFFLFRFVNEERDVIFGFFLVNVLVLLIMRVFILFSVFSVLVFLMRMFVCVFCLMLIMIDMGVVNFSV